MTSASQRSPKLGRPRAFDADEAIEAAMHVFWKHGYEGASLRALTKAMGIDRKSMYLAFGDKESLFRKALDRYSTIQLSYLLEALERRSVAEFVDELFVAALKFYGDEKHPRTCMSLQGFAMGEETQSVRNALIEWRVWVEKQYRIKFERARQEGELPKESRPAELARYLAVIMAGLAVQASNGASLAELKQSARMFRHTMPFLSKHSAI